MLVCDSDIATNTASHIDDEKVERLRHFCNRVGRGLAIVRYNSDSLPRQPIRHRAIWVKACYRGPEAVLLAQCPDMDVSNPRAVPLNHPRTRCRGIGKRFDRPDRDDFNAERFRRRDDVASDLELDGRAEPGVRLPPRRFGHPVILGAGRVDDRQEAFVFHHAIPHLECVLGEHPSPVGRIERALE